jgi:hypothetical protein
MGNPSLYRFAFEFALSKLQVLGETRSYNFNISHHFSILENMVPVVFQKMGLYCLYAYQASAFELIPKRYPKRFENPQSLTQIETSVRLNRKLDKT